MIRKSRAVLSIWLIFSTSAQMCSGVVLAETKPESDNDVLPRETIQSNVVENEFTDKSTAIKEDEDDTVTEESSTRVPENTEPEKTPNSSPKITRGVLDAVASKITVESTGIVLKADGSYLLMDEPRDYADGTYDPATHVKEEGLYDENTIIEIANTGSFTDNQLYSERRSSGINRIQQIIITDGTNGELTILSDSALDIQNNLDYGIKVPKLIIGEKEELDWKPVDLNVTSSKIGIHTIDGTDNITGNVHATASQAGISITDENPPSRDNYSEMAAFRKKLEQGNAYGEYKGEIGTKMYAEATGSSGSGAVFSMYTLDGAELTGKSDSNGYGVFSTDGVTVETSFGIAGEGTDRTYVACLTGEASNGIGVFVEGILTNYGGTINGTALTGNGVESNYYESYPESHNAEEHLSELNGSTDTGFGIIMRSFSEYGGSYEIDAGAMQLTSGEVNGQSKDGTGIFSGELRVTPEQKVDIWGSAIKGQGIVGKEMLTDKFNDPKPKLSILGESTGESSTTVSTIEELCSDVDILNEALPVSAGIILLRGMEHSGVDLSLKGTAPIALDRSYGIYSCDGVESRLSIIGDKSVTIEAEGDWGIKVSQLEARVENALSDTEGLISVEVDARSVGIETARDVSINSYCETERDTGSKVDITASEGSGIVSPLGLRLYFTGDPNSFQIPITIDAKDIAINADNSLGDENSGSKIILFGTNIKVINADIGIKGVRQQYYEFMNNLISIKTLNEGINLEEPDEPGYMMISETSMDIESGTYGLKTENISINIDGGGSQRSGHLSDLIDVTAQQYPIWLTGSFSADQPILTIYNGKNFDEDWNEQPNELRITTTSKGLKPDDGNHPAFYVEDHALDIDGSQEDIKIIENYETKVSEAFNTTPSTPYSTSANFNIEKYSNYEWTATRTDTNNNVVVDTSQAAQNKLFTSDTDYQEAKLTAKRMNHKSGERIFVGEDSVGTPDMILHEINMIVRREQQYSVTYDSNGADGGITPNDPTLYNQGDTVNVSPKGDLSKTDHEFVGWLNSEDNQIYQNPFLSSSPTTYTMGQADITFTAQWQPESSGEELELLTADIPDDLKFGTHKIDYSSDKTYYATDSSTDNENVAAADITTGGVGVKDTRLSSTGWTLTVKQLTQFKNASNQEITGAQLSFKVGQPDLSQSTGGVPSGVSNQKVTLTPMVSSTLLQAASGQGKGIVELPIENFTLEVPGNAEKYVSEYTTQLEWLVSDVP